MIYDNLIEELNKLENNYTTSFVLVDNPFRKNYSKSNDYLFAQQQHQQQQQQQQLQQQSSRPEKDSVLQMCLMIGYGVHFNVYIVRSSSVCTYDS